MKKARRVVWFSMGLALVALIGLCSAVAAPQEPPPPETPVAAAGQSSGHEDGHSRSGDCAPVAGAWIAQLTPQKDEKSGKTATIATDSKGKKAKPILKTFKFAPIDDKCDQFVVNAQTVTRPQRVINTFPEVTDLTEFVGVACQIGPNDVNFTAISYGVERTEDADKTIFIAVLSGKIELPKKDWGKYADLSSSSEKHEHDKDNKKDGGKDGDHQECDEPKELTAKLTVAYFDAEQDEDGDGFPDKGEEAIICLAFDAKLKRVELQPQCKPSKGHTVTATADVQG